MELSVLDIKTTDITVGRTDKSTAGATKADNESFTMVYEACVDNCAGETAKEGEGVDEKTASANSTAKPVQVGKLSEVVAKASAGSVVETALTVLSEEPVKTATVAAGANGVTAENSEVFSANGPSSLNERAATVDVKADHVAVLTFDTKIQATPTQAVTAETESKLIQTDTAKVTAKPVGANNALKDGEGKVENNSKKSKGLKATVKGTEGPEKLKAVSGRAEKNEAEETVQTVMTTVINNARLKVSAPKAEDNTAAENRTNVLENLSKNTVGKPAEAVKTERMSAEGLNELDAQPPVSTRPQVKAQESVAVGMDITKADVEAVVPEITTQVKVAKTVEILSEAKSERTHAKVNQPYSNDVEMPTEIKKVVVNHPAEQLAWAVDKSVIDKDDTDRQATGLSASGEKSDKTMDDLKRGFFNEAVKGPHATNHELRAPVTATDKPEGQNRIIAAGVNGAQDGTDFSAEKDEKRGANEHGRKNEAINGVNQYSMQATVEKFRVGLQGVVKAVEPLKPEAVFEKLSSGVKMSLGANGKDVSITLSPEHLGSMNIKMVVDEQTVKAHITVESEAVKTVLDSDSGKLKDVFARHGLTLDKYTVELAANSLQSGANSPFTENPSRQNPYYGSSVTADSVRGAEDGVAPIQYRHSENTRRNSGGVDLFI